MRLVCILVIIALSFSLRAESDQAFLPLANTEDILAAKINPAAMAHGNATGLGLILYNDRNLNFIKNEFSLIFNFRHLGYSYEKREGFEIHSLYSSHKITRNLFAGLDYSWRNSNFKNGAYEISTLFRPFDYISLAAKAMEINKDDPVYMLGGSIRPVPAAEGAWDRLSLSCDVSYDGKDWLKPVVGLQTELVDGLFLGAGYDLERESPGINFKLAFNKIKVGSLIGLDDKNEIRGGSTYLELNTLSYRSIFERDHQNDLLEFKLRGEIREKDPGFRLGPFRFISGQNNTLSNIISQIKKYRKDEKIDGLVLKNASFSASLAQTMELRDALMDFKRTGKKVIFYYDSISNMNYIFASSVADEIYLHPQGDVQLRGISISMPYISDLLDTLGIEIVNLKSHDYKTAGNILSESEMTPAEAESYNYILDGLYSEMEEMLESGWGDRLKAPAAEIIDEGPYYIGQKALEAGLVDALIYEDQLENILKEKYDGLKIHGKFDKNRIRYDWSDPAKDKIAVIYAVGNIHRGEGNPGSSIGAETTARAIRKARESDSIKGIILRIDSGGGSALASDIIAREVALCGESDNYKPVIVSMSGVAGSGGYYIAAPADMIVAQPSTITGSIGVIGIMANLERLYDKVRINWSTLKRGQHADIGTSKRALTEKEKQLLEEAIQDSYERFVSLVAEYRNMSYEDIHEIAQGRIWTGKQALERGLVDRLGGMDVALSEMKRLAVLDREVELVEFEGLKQNGLSINIGYETRLYQLLSLPEDFNSLYKISQRIRQLSSERVLMVLPHDLEIE